MVVAVVVILVEGGGVGEGVLACHFTDLPWFLPVGNKVSYIYSTLHCVVIMAVISQLRVLASHTGNLGSVAQGALELEHWKIRKCHFLRDPNVLGYIF